MQLFRDGIFIIGLTTQLDLQVTRVSLRTWPT